MDNGVTQKITIALLMVLAGLLVGFYFSISGEMNSLLGEEHMSRLFNVKVAPIIDTTQLFKLQFVVVGGILFTLIIEEVSRTRLINNPLIAITLRPITAIRKLIGHEKSWVVAAPLSATLILFGVSTITAVIAVDLEVAFHDNHFNVSPAHGDINDAFELARLAVITGLLVFMFCKPLAMRGELLEKRSSLTTHAVFIAPYVTQCIYYILFLGKTPPFEPTVYSSISVDYIGMLVLTTTTLIYTFLIARKSFERETQKKNLIYFGLLPFVLLMALTTLSAHLASSALKPSDAQVLESSHSKTESDTHAVDINGRSVDISTEPFEEPRDAMLLAYSGEFRTSNIPRYDWFSAAYFGNEVKAIEVIATLSKGFTEKARPVVEAIWEKQPIALPRSAMAGLIFFGLATSDIDWQINDTLLEFALNKDYQGYLDFYHKHYLNRTAPPKTNITYITDAGRAGYKMGDEAAALIAVLIIEGELAVFDKESITPEAIELFNKKVDVFKFFANYTIEAGDKADVVAAFEYIARILDIQ